MPSVAPDAQQQPATTVSVSGGRKPAPPPTNGGDGRHRWPSTHSFIFMCHPMHLDVYPVGVDEKGAMQFEVLPYIEQLEYKPGLNGVRHVKGYDDGDPTAAIAAMEARGYKRVPTDWQVEAFGEECDGYVHAFDGVAGPIHLCVWNRLYQVGDESYILPDRPGYIEFQRRVLKEILGGRLNDHAMTGLRRKLEERERAGAAGNATPSAKLNTEEMRLRLKLLPATGMSAVPAPSSTPKRGNKPAAPPKEA